MSYLFRKDSMSGKTTLAMTATNSSLYDRIYWRAKIIGSDDNRAIWDLYPQAATGGLIYLRGSNCQRQNLISSTTYKPLINEAAIREEFRKYMVPIEQALVRLSTGCYICKAGTQIKSSLLFDLRAYSDPKVFAVIIDKFGVAVVGFVRDEGDRFAIIGNFVEACAIEKSQITDGMNWVLIEGVSMNAAEYEMPRTIDAIIGSRRNDQLVDDDVTKALTSIGSALRSIDTYVSGKLSSLVVDNGDGTKSEFSAAEIRERLGLYPNETGDLDYTAIAKEAFIEGSRKFDVSILDDLALVKPLRGKVISLTEAIEDLSSAQSIKNFTKDKYPVDRNKTNTSQTTFTCTGWDGSVVSYCNTPSYFMLNVKRFCWIDSALMFALAPDKIRMKGSGSAAFVQALATLTYTSAMLIWPNLGVIDPLAGAEVDGLVTGMLEALGQEDGLLRPPIVYTHRLSVRNVVHLLVVKIDELSDVEGKEIDVLIMNDFDGSRSGWVFVNKICVGFMPTIKLRTVESWDNEVGFNEQFDLKENPDVKSLVEVYLTSEEDSHE